MTTVHFRPVVFLRDPEKDLPTATYKMEHRFHNVIAGRMFPDMDVHISYDKDKQTVYYVTKCPLEFFEEGKRIKFDRASFSTDLNPKADVPNWTELCAREGPTVRPAANQGLWMWTNGEYSLFISRNQRGQYVLPSVVRGPTAVGGVTVSWSPMHCCSDR